MCNWGDRPCSGTSCGAWVASGWPRGHATGWATSSSTTTPAARPGSRPGELLGRGAAPGHLPAARRGPAHVYVNADGLDGHTALQSRCSTSSSAPCPRSPAMPVSPSRRVACGSPCAGATTTRWRGWTGPSACRSPSPACARGRQALRRLRRRRRRPVEPERPEAPMSPEPLPLGATRPSAGSPAPVGGSRAGRGIRASA